jgi:hypothetical protein
LREAARCLLCAYDLLWPGGGWVVACAHAREYVHVCTRVSVQVCVCVCGLGQGMAADWFGVDLCVCVCACMNPHHST